MTLAAKGKKGKSKKGASTNGDKGKGKQKKEGKEKNLSKVKCWACQKMEHWACQKMEHYAVTCLEKKNKGKGKNVVASTEIDEFASEFEREFSFIASLSTSVAPSSIRFVDSEASRHMTGVREHFSEFIEKRLILEVVLGDDCTVRVVGEGIVLF